MTANALLRLLAPSLLALGIFTLAPAVSSAKTPDGMPPSQETVCSGFHGAAFGLCNAYCEAQDCDVHPRPSCEHLLHNFRKITGMPAFPCDFRCGNEVIDPNEDCDPPGSACPDRRRVCSSDCTCPQPSCGDGILDPGEQCDPGGVSICPCRPDCTCETTPLGCCECPDGCLPEPATGCPAGCPALPGLTCGPFTGQCETPVPTCCQCSTGIGCFDANSPDACVAQNCAAVPGASCSDEGCVGFGPAP
jgi:hypothetical protein